MRVLMLKSVTLMPQWRVLDDGTEVDLDEKTAKQFIDAGIARAVPVVEFAVPAAPVETATAPPQRKRKQA